MKDQHGMPGRTRTIIMCVLIAALIVAGSVNLFLMHDAASAAPELLSAALFGLTGLLDDLRPKRR